MRRMVLASAGLMAALIATGHAMPSETQSPPKLSILVHVTHGPENTTRAALGFLVARTG